MSVGTSVCGTVQVVLLIVPMVPAGQSVTVGILIVRQIQEPVGIAVLTDDVVDAHGHDLRVLRRIDVTTPH
jgi:hypothetical protein